MNTDRIAKYIDLYNAAVAGRNDQSIRAAAHALSFTLEDEGA